VCCTPNKQAVKLHSNQLLLNADELLRRCPVQIATAAQLEPATRSLAAECLVTLCEARDKVSEAPARLMSLTSESPSNQQHALSVQLGTLISRIKLSVQEHAG
jgi:hypothetical protein